MSAQQKNHLSAAEIADLEAWAEKGDFADIDLTGAVTGDEALAAGRSLMEAAGVDLWSHL